MQSRNVRMKWLAILAVVATGLALAPSDSEKEKAKEHRVKIDDLKYEPARIKVRKGEMVVWINEDDRDHTVVCRDKDKEKSFNSGKIAAKGKFKFTFKNPGTYQYGCSYHPRMKATVEVVD